MSYCCPFSGNIEKFRCGMAKGGLKGAIYAANVCEIDEITSSTSDKSFDAITMLIDPLTTNPYFWYEINFKKGSAGFLNELQKGNNTFNNQTLTFAIEGITAASLAVLESMSTAQVVFIVTDYQGVNHLLGRIDGLEMTASSYGSGTAQDDIYGGTITFSAGEPEFSNIVASGTTIEVFNGTTTDTVTLP